LRIGLVIYGTLETLTGGFLYDRIVVNHLVSNGNEVEGFSLPWRDYPRHLTDNLSEAFFRELAAARLDVLVEDELNHPSLVWVNRRLRKRVTYPIVSIVHHLRCCELRPAWQNWIYRKVERSYLDTVDGFVFNSETTRCAVEDLLGKPTRGVGAYPGGDRVRPQVTADRIRQRAAENGPLQVLFVGSLIPRKELHTLLAALGSLGQESIRLEVVGGLDTDPEYVARIKRDIRTLGLDGRVSLRGTVTGPELERLYAESHVLAVPSSYEGFGIVYLEGMGFGLPAIACNVGAAHEIVTDGRTGFLIRPGDRDALGRVLRRLCRDREQLAEMGVAARERFAAHPTWEQSAGKIAEFLKAMVK
jgi:glycosyltransferase involved in cell wall biosynthesis